MRARALVLAVALGLFGACRAEPPAPPGAPPSLQGSLVVEPPRFGVGQVTEVEIAVVTPPDRRVLPIAPPKELPGFWLLDTEPRPVEQRDDRWIHRTRFRLRARAVGVHTWPALSVRIEGPGDTISPLEIAARELEVVSVRADHPERTTPFGLRRPAGGGSPWPPMALGAALMGLAMGGVAAWRRWGSLLAPAPEPERPARVRAWDEALAALDAARAEPDAAAAAGEAARITRRYLAHRYGADSMAATTEELRTSRPPYAVRSRWRGVLGLLGRLDALRFPAELPADASERVTAAIGEVQQLVRDTTPPRGLR